ncbi:cytochrome P450 71D10-like isoform X1 [Silene latifolia]|uniref:cytochrome P450 71D10-like isoform X1 n=1 Tax=Silene latifolia TaxID=37657 RepID=UPI003D785762
MSIPFSPWIIPLFIILLPILTKLISKTFLRPFSKQKLPPGPSKLPIIGNLHQLASKTTPPPQRLQELAKIYGPIMHLRLGEVPTIVISSAEVAKDILRTHDTNFANRPKLLAAKVMYYGCTDIALAPYGEYWRQVRKIATVELLTVKRVQSFRVMREEEVCRFVEGIALESKVGDGCVNLSELLFGLLFNLTSRVVFSKRGIDQAAFRDLITKMSKAFSGFAIEDIFPSMKLLHSIGGMKKMLKEMAQESNRLLDPIVNGHKSNIKTEENLVDVLMKFHQDNVLDSSEFSLSTNNIKAIILEIFGAGSETSSTTIEWAMSELLKNPKAMKKAQEEVRRVYNGYKTIDETKLEELKYLKSVIKESLRLHPPVPLLVPRESIEDCQIQGYDIPSKTRVIMNAYAIGRDPNYWPDSNVFKPERFENSSIDFKGNDFELIPFGAGRRMCPGLTLGVANVELPLAMLLYHFDWKLPNGMKAEDLDMDELFGITMRRKNDLLIIPIPYSSFVM